jgi:hypothetical protein
MLAFSELVSNESQLTEAINSKVDKISEDDDSDLKRFVSEKVPELERII